MTRQTIDSVLRVFPRKHTLFHRLQAATLGLAALLVSSSVSALGLGEVKLSSALNQPLNASIVVYTNTPEEGKGLSAKLASPAAFKRAGIDRPAYLNDMQVSVAGTEADPAISLKTKLPFREPFVHFLLEVSWEQGRLRREYTLLLDPPVTQAAPKMEKSTSASKRAAKPVSKAPVRSAKAVSKPVSESAEKGYEFGPVAKGTTLWGVASKLAKRSGVSVQQMMLGLLRNNPQAFHGNNVNSMKPGHVLKVPPRSQLQSISTDNAIRQVRGHNKEWNAIGGDVTRLTRLPGQAAPTVAAKPRRPAAKPQQSGAQLKIVGQQADTAQVVKKATENAIAPWQQRVKSLEAELNLANEAAESRRLENQGLSSRLSRLEGTVNDMQRLISMKDNMIASLQDNLSRMQSEATAAPDSATPPAKSVSPKATQPAAQVAPVTKPSQVKPAKPEAPKPTIDRKNFKIDYGNQQPETSLFDDLLGNPLLLVGALLLLIFPWVFFLKKRKAKQEEKDEGDDVMVVDLDEAEAEADRDEENEKKSRFSLAGLFKRKSKDEGEDGSSDELVTDTDAEVVAEPVKKKGLDLTNLDFKKWFSFGKKKDQAVEEDGGSGVSAAAVTAGLAGAAAVAGVASMASDEDEGDAPTPGKPDVLNEVDQFLAHSRHDQALAMLNDALAEDPENEALLVKRLEAHHLAGNAVEFESQAEAFYADRNGVDDATWKTVRGWGRDLCPQNPLFSDTVPDTDMLASFSSALDDDVVELDDLGLDSDFDNLDVSGLDLGSDLGLGGEAALEAAESSIDADKPDAQAGATDEAMGELNPDLDLDGDLLNLGGVSESGNDDTADDGLIFDMGDTPVIDEAAMATVVDEDLVPGLEMEVATEDQGGAAIDPDELEMLFGSAPTTDDAVVEDDFGVSGVKADLDDAASSDVDNGVTMESFDSLDIPEIVSDEAPVTDASVNADEEDEIEFDLSGLEFSEADDMAHGIAGNVDSLAVPESSRDGELEDQFAALESEIDMVDNALEENAEISTEPDEVDTKLDLARAYIDMGDPEGARVMLEEVLEEGSAKQQQDAKSLIGQIE